MSKSKPTLAFSKLNKAIHSAILKAFNISPVMKNTRKVPLRSGINPTHPNKSPGSYNNRAYYSFSCSSYNTAHVSYGGSFYNGAHVSYSGSVYNPVIVPSSFSWASIMQEFSYRDTCGVQAVFPSEMLPGAYVSAAGDTCFTSKLKDEVREFIEYDHITNALVDQGFLTGETCFFYLDKKNKNIYFYQM